MKIKKSLLFCCLSFAPGILFASSNCPGISEFAIFLNSSSVYYGEFKDNNGYHHLLRSLPFGNANSVKQAVDYPYRLMGVDYITQKPEPKTKAQVLSWAKLNMSKVNQAYRVSSDRCTYNIVSKGKVTPYGFIMF